LKRKIRLSVLAERDLIAIWEYSLEEWGAAHADKYLDELDVRLRALAGSPKSGAVRDDVRRKYRALFVNRHVVYYTVSLWTIHIVRVLHGQMDPSKHL
jgi:toxin ParE1/3/4